MSSCVFDEAYKINYKTYHALEIENKKLQEQNFTLINKLEQITCEFGKSQTKVKNLESRNSNNNNVNGNLTSLLEMTKELEGDNKRLCKELKHQITLNKMSEIPMDRTQQENNHNHFDEIEHIKISYEEKITNLKCQIQGLRNKIVQTQKQCHENECSYKISQIQTLEALKASKLENDSLKEKISKLEATAETVLSVHTRNLELKTSVNHSENDLKLLKLNLEDVRLKLTESINAHQQDQKSYENQLSIYQQKANDLLEENKILAAIIEENNIITNSPKLVSCEKCEEYDNRLVDREEQLQTIKGELSELKEDKKKIADDYLSQISIIERFEGEQNKLREKINQLTGLKFSFDLNLKSKSNEVENLTCQLESSIQRLDIREQRINELTKQLNGKVTEEDDLKKQLLKLTEKFDHMQDEINQYRSQLSNTLEEKSLVLKNQIALESALTEKSIANDELKQKLVEMTSSNSELQQSLQSHTSMANAKIHEYTMTIGDLKEKIEELNYSINIYETHNDSLESESKEIQLKLEKMEVKYRKLLEVQKRDIDKYELQLREKEELLTKLNSEMNVKDSKIKDLTEREIELDQQISEKDDEVESLAIASKTVEEELENLKGHLGNVQSQLQQYKEKTEQLDKFEIESKNKSKKNKKLKQNLAELLQRVELLNTDLFDEKQKREALQSDLVKSENGVEKLHVKINCMKEQLEHKTISLESFIQTHQFELNQLSEKLHSSETDRDDYCKKMRSAEEANVQLESLITRNQEEIDFLKQMILTQKQEIAIKEKSNRKSESKITVLQNHLSCSQRHLVDRSREIDRLEQLVRDRSDQIEKRSNQLEAFEKDLESKLLESQQQLDQAKRHETLCGVELEKLKDQNKEYSDKLSLAIREHRELSDYVQKKDAEYNSLTNQMNKLNNENKSLLDTLNTLKGDLISKTALVKELLGNLNKKEQEIEQLSDEKENKIADIKAKSWQIRQLEDQTKKSKANFMETESKLIAENRLIQKKLDSFNQEKEKAIELAIKNISMKCQKTLEKLRISDQTLNKTKTELEDMSIKLFTKEEQIAELKIQVSTQSAVMIDLETSGRLKAVVIENLLKKVDNLTCGNLSRSINGNNTTICNGSFNAEMKSEQKNSICEEKKAWEDMSLQELLRKINVRLNNNGKYNKE